MAKNSTAQCCTAGAIYNQIEEIVSGESLSVMKEQEEKGKIQDFE